MRWTTLSSLVTTSTWPCRNRYSRESPTWVHITWPSAGSIHSTTIVQCMRASSVLRCPGGAAAPCGPAAPSGSGSRARNATAVVAQQAFDAGHRTLGRLGPAPVAAGAVGQHGVVAVARHALRQRVFVVPSCALLAAGGHADADHRRHRRFAPQALDLLLVRGDEGLAEQGVKVFLRLFPNGVVVLQIQVPQPGPAVHGQQAVHQRTGRASLDSSACGRETARACPRPPRAGRPPSRWRGPPDRAWRRPSPPGLRESRAAAAAASAPAPERASGENLSGLLSRCWMTVTPARNSCLVLARTAMSCRAPSTALRNTQAHLAAGGPPPHAAPPSTSTPAPRQNAAHRAWASDRPTNGAARPPARVRRAAPMKRVTAWRAATGQVWQPPVQAVARVPGRHLYRRGLPGRVQRRAGGLAWVGCIGAGGSASGEPEQRQSGSVDRPGQAPLTRRLAPRWPSRSWDQEIRTAGRPTSKSPDPYPRPAQTALSIEPAASVALMASGRQTGRLRTQGPPANGNRRGKLTVQGKGVEVVGQARRGRQAAAATAAERADTHSRAVAA